jgi:hypothetical protein
MQDEVREHGKKKAMIGVGKLPIQKKEDLSTELVEWLDERRKAKKTAVIVGFAGTTRELAPLDDPNVEVWGINEAYHHGFMNDSNGNLRGDRWFQIHKPWSYQRPDNRNHPEHWEWLQEEHPFPVYMQIDDPSVPSGVPLPLEEIVEKFCRNSWRGGDKEPEPIEYFTSSFAYMAGMAALLYSEGVIERVEVYGFEMSTMTEYHFQKGSTEWWLGKLDGMGIEIYVPQYCQLLWGAKYGYEVTQMINRQELEFRENQLKELEAQKVAALNGIAGRRQQEENVVNGLQARLRTLNPLFNKKQIALIQEQIQEHLLERGKFMQQEINALGEANAVGGALQEVQMFIKYVDAQYNFADAEMEPVEPAPAVQMIQVGEPLIEGEPDEQEAQEEQT